MALAYHIRHMRIVKWHTRNLAIGSPFQREHGMQSVSEPQCWRNALPKNDDSVCAIFISAIKNATSGSGVIGAIQHKCDAMARRTRTVGEANSRRRALRPRKIRRVLATIIGWKSVPPAMHSIPLVGTVISCSNSLSTTREVFLHVPLGRDLLKPRVKLEPSARGRGRQSVGRPESAGRRDSKSTRHRHP